MNIKGKLVIIGGAEDKGDTEKHRLRDHQEFLESGILARVVEESKLKKKSRIEIVTTASTVPKETGDDYIRAFKKLSTENLGIISIETREQAADPEMIKRLDAADVVFFTGGSQLRLTTVLGGTPFYDKLLERLQSDKNFIYAGTSAGAAAASDAMIALGSSTDAFLKGGVKTTAGFGFIKDVVFDTHFIQRGRIGRLLELLVSNPKTLGIGLEENTGLLITKNNTRMEAIGPGPAIIVDGRSIRNTNLLDIREGASISIDNLTMHVMSQNDVYDLDENRLSIINSDQVLR